jgi:hypothetical protein
MKATNILNQFEQEFDYFDYLITTVRKPHHKGVLKSINRKIKTVKVFIETESRNPTDLETLEQAKTLLKKFLELKQRHYLIHAKK